MYTDRCILTDVTKLCTLTEVIVCMLRNHNIVAGRKLFWRKLTNHCTEGCETRHEDNSKRTSNVSLNNRTGLLTQAGEREMYHNRLET